MVVLQRDHGNTPETDKRKNSCQVSLVHVCRSPSSEVLLRAYSFLHPRPVMAMCTGSNTSYIDTMLTQKHRNWFLVLTRMANHNLDSCCPLALFLFVFSVNRHNNYIIITHLGFFKRIGLSWIRIEGRERHWRPCPRAPKCQEVDGFDFQKHHFKAFSIGWMVLREV